MCSAVAMLRRRVSWLTSGPTPLMLLGSSKLCSASSSRSQACSPCSLFSQNSCLGLSGGPCLKSERTLPSWERTTVTGCLKMEAVWRMGGTREASLRMPRL
uniref:Putative secreted protein n=1 Tax=Ixodes ricinus TaxID=34613 RepID=A0A6B0UEY7_IXORI